MTVVTEAKRKVLGRKFLHPVGTGCNLQGKKSWFLLWKKQTAFLTGRKLKQEGNQRILVIIGGRWGCPEGKDTPLKPTSTFECIQEQEFKHAEPSVVDPPSPFKVIRFLLIRSRRLLWDYQSLLFPQALNYWLVVPARWCQVQVKRTGFPEIMSHLVRKTDWPYNSQFVTKPGNNFPFMPSILLLDTSKGFFFQ